jgi:hypothetical protein
MLILKNSFLSFSATIDFALPARERSAPTSACKRLILLIPDLQQSSNGLKGLNHNPNLPNLLQQIQGVLLLLDNNRLFLVWLWTLHDDRWRLIWLHDPPGRKQPRPHDEFEPAAGFDQFLPGDTDYMTNDPCSMTNFQSFESRKSCPRQRSAKKSEMRPMPAARHFWLDFTLVSCNIFGSLFATLYSA